MLMIVVDAPLKVGLHLLSVCDAGVWIGLGRAPLAVGSVTPLKGGWGLNECAISVRCDHFIGVGIVCFVVEVVDFRYEIVISLSFGSSNTLLDKIDYGR